MQETMKEGRNKASAEPEGLEHNKHYQMYVKYIIKSNINPPTHPFFTWNITTHNKSHKERTLPTHHPRVTRPLLLTVFRRHHCLRRGTTSRCPPTSPFSTHTLTFQNQREYYQHDSLSIPGQMTKTDAIIKKCVTV